MKKKKAFLIAMLIAIAASFQANNARADELSKTADGIKAILKLDPAKSMVDFYISDAKTGKGIEDAEVEAIITLPDGKKVEKELMGMKMGGDAFSFMNTLDMSLNGNYNFDIMVEAGKTRVNFNFEQRIDRR